MSTSKVEIKTELLSSGRIIVIVSRGTISMSEFIYNESDIKGVIPALLKAFQEKLDLLDKVNAAIKGLV